MYGKQLYGFSHEVHIWSGPGYSVSQISIQLYFPKKRYSFAVSLQTTIEEKMTELWAVAISLY